MRYNGTARTQAVQLPDGSSVTIQPTSQLRYRAGFAGGQRAVYLRGEAFFRVAHDAAHPFRVLTADLETRVLGTSFTVRAYPQQAETVVQVHTGRVRVQPLRLAAGGFRSYHGGGSGGPGTAAQPVGRVRAGSAAAAPRAGAPARAVGPAALRL